MSLSKLYLGERLHMLILWKDAEVPVYKNTEFS